MADGRGLRIRNALLAWDRLAAFPVGMCRAAEPVLKEQIYKKSSCEFSFFFPLRAGRRGQNQPQTRHSIDQAREMWARLTDNS